jgi:hypothetical protein
MKTIKFPKQIRSHINENKEKLFPEDPHFQTPDLRKKQTFVNNAKKSSDKIVEVINFINEHKYQEDMDENKPFVFGLDHDYKNEPIIGDCAALQHFRIGITSFKI